MNHVGAVVSPQLILAPSTSSLKNSSDNTESNLVTNGCTKQKTNKPIRILRPHPLSDTTTINAFSSGPSTTATSALTSKLCEKKQEHELRLPTLSECLARVETTDCVYYVCKTEFVIGRGSNTSPADVWIGDKVVSRQHLRLTSGADGWRLKCNSKNGVRFNGTHYMKDAGHFLLPTECSLGFSNKDTDPIVHFTTELSKYLPKMNEFSPGTHPEDPGCTQSITQCDPNESCDSFAEKNNLPTNFDASLEHGDADESFDGNDESECDNNDHLKTESKDGKPPYSYAMLIVQAIGSSSERRMTLAGIYNYIMSHYNFYKTCCKGWQNSIRHNLSLNRCFDRAARTQEEPGKGSFWFIKPEFEERLIADAFKERRRGKSSSTTLLHHQAGATAAAALASLAVSQSSSSQFVGSVAENVAKQMPVAWYAGGGDHSATSSSSDLSSFSPYPSNVPYLTPSILSNAAISTTDIGPSSSALITIRNERRCNTNDDHIIMTSSTSLDKVYDAMDSIGVAGGDKNSTSDSCGPIGDLVIVERNGLPAIKIEKSQMISLSAQYDIMQQHTPTVLGYTSDTQRTSYDSVTSQSSFILDTAHAATNNAGGNTLRLPVVPQHYDSTRLFNFATAAPSVDYAELLRFVNTSSMVIGNDQQQQLMKQHIQQFNKINDTRTTESAPVSPSQFDKPHTALDIMQDKECLTRVDHSSGANGSSIRRLASCDGRQRLRICFSPPEITPVPSRDTSALKHLTHQARHRNSSGFRQVALLRGQRGGTKSLSTSPVRDVLAQPKKSKSLPTPIASNNHANVPSAVTFAEPTTSAVPQQHVTKRAPVPDNRPRQSASKFSSSKCPISSKSVPSPLYTTGIQMTACPSRPPATHLSQQQPLAQPLNIAHLTANMWPAAGGVQIPPYMSTTTTTNADLAAAFLAPQQTALLHMLNVAGGLPANLLQAGHDQNVMYNLSQLVHNSSASNGTSASFANNNALQHLLAAMSHRQVPQQPPAIDANMLSLLLAAGLQQQAQSANPLLTSLSGGLINSGANFAPTMAMMTAGLNEALLRNSRIPPPPPLNVAATATSTAFKRTASGSPGGSHYGLYDSVSSKMPKRE